MPEINKDNRMKIYDCLEWILTSINHENGYQTNGLLVDRDKDPRLVKQDKHEEYLEYNAAITIKKGDRRLIEEKSVGGVQRWEEIIQLFGIVTLTTEEEEAELTLDVKESLLQQDINNALYKHTDCYAPAIALGFTKQGNESAKDMSCIGLKVSHCLSGDILQFPDSTFIMLCKVEYDEHMSR